MRCYLIKLNYVAGVDLLVCKLNFDFDFDFNVYILLSLFNKVETWITLSLLSHLLLTFKFWCKFNLNKFFHPGYLTCLLLGNLMVHSLVSSTQTKCKKSVFIKLGKTNGRFKLGNLKVLGGCWHPVFFSTLNQ